MVVHQNITNLAGYFHFLNVRKIPYVISTVRVTRHVVLSFLAKKPRFKVKFCLGLASVGRTIITASAKITKSHARNDKGALCAPLSL